MRWFIPLMLICFSGCAGGFPGMLQRDTCPRPTWYMNVDGLPDPAFPERHNIGDAFVLMGVVRDSVTCAPLPDVTVMFDMTNPEGDYDGTQTGTTYTNALGMFVIRSDRPGAYGGGAPHIHLFVGRDGYLPITTAHDLLTPDDWGVIDISIEPSR